MNLLGSSNKLAVNDRNNQQQAVVVMFYNKQWKRFHWNPTTITVAIQNIIQQTSQYFGHQSLTSRFSVQKLVLFEIQAKLYDYWKIYRLKSIPTRDRSVRMPNRAKILYDRPFLLKINGYLSIFSWQRDGPKTFGIIESVCLLKRGISRVFLYILTFHVRIKIDIHLDYSDLQSGTKSHLK